MSDRKVNPGEAIEGDLGIPADIDQQSFDPPALGRSRALRPTRPVPDPSGPRGDHTLRVRHVERDRFLLEIRDHMVLVDQPVDAGGDDTGPTPTELFIGSIAACTAFFAERFLVRHGITRDELTVSASYEMSGGGPVRVTAVDLDVHLPPSFPPDRRPALLAVLERCTVKNSLREAPEVRVALRTAATAA
jgi:putative redox protein